MMRESDFKTKYEKDGKVLQILKQGILNLQVCTNIDKEKIKQIVDDIYPCGTTLGWVLSKRKEVAPIACAEKKGFTHYIMDC